MWHWGISSLFEVETVVEIVTGSRELELAMVSAELAFVDVAAVVPVAGHAVGNVAVGAEAQATNGRQVEEARSAVWLEHGQERCTERSASDSSRQDPERM